VKRANPESRNTARVWIPGPHAGLANTAHIEGGIDAWMKAGGPALTG
jgi:rhodanese-related sulfurtransferase